MVKPAEGSPPSGPLVKLCRTVNVCAPDAAPAKPIRAISRIAVSGLDGGLAWRNILAEVGLLLSLRLPPRPTRTGPIGGRWRNVKPADDDRQINCTLRFNSMVLNG